MNGIEQATIIYRDGRRKTLQRQKGSKTFDALGPDGKTTGLSYSRRKLEERPQIDRSIDKIEFSKTG